MQVNTPIVVGIADCALSKNPGDTLITYALGSCIGVAIYDPVAKLGGLLHYMLPDSALESERGKKNPYVFADTGIPLLFKRAFESGAEKRRLIVRVAGGAQVLDGADFFNVGKRNHVSMRRVLWKAGVLVHAETVGGNVSRSMRMEIGSGKVWVREGVQPAQELVPASAKTPFQEQIRCLFERC
jgi:chemotaxis protein CheD